MVRSRSATTVTAMIVDEEATLTISEVSGICRIRDEMVIELVEEGILRPRGGSPEEWRFSLDNACRAKVALRLRRDLGVNLAGAALAAELIEELRQLRGRVRQLEALLGSAEPSPRSGS